MANDNRNHVMVTGQLSPEGADKYARRIAMAQIIAAVSIGLAAIIAALGVWLK